MVYNECACGWKKPQACTIEAKPEILQVLISEKPKNSQPVNWLGNMKKILNRVTYVN
jgi:hypothetical protein